MNAQCIYMIFQRCALPDDVVFIKRLSLVQPFHLTTLHFSALAPLCCQIGSIQMKNKTKISLNVT